MMMQGKLKLQCKQFLFFDCDNVNANMNIPRYLVVDHEIEMYIY